MKGRIVIDIADDGGALIQGAYADKPVNWAVIRKTTDEQVEEVRRSIELIIGGSN